MDNKKIDIMSNIKNILPENDRSKLVNCNGDNFFNKEKPKQLEFDFSEPIESKEIKVNTTRLTNLGLIK